LSTASRTIYDKVRKIFPKFIEDEPKYKDLNRVREFLENSANLINF